jgi:hypothetical protein
MAFGIDRVIHLKEKNLRISPDPFSGLKEMGIEIIEYIDQENLLEKLAIVSGYIERKADEISPIIIGAAISTADGYFNNFILRFWENIRKGFIDINTKEEFHPDISQIRMNIYIPYEISSNLKENILNYYEINNYKQGMITQGTFRGVELRYKKVGNEYIISDYPSTLTASYNTVKDILNLNADERHDKNAEERFLMKERDSFLFTLNKLMTEESLTLKLKTFSYYKKDETKIQEILNLMKQVKIIELKKPGSRYGSNPIHY